MKLPLSLIACAASLCAPALAAEQAFTVRQTDVKAKPFTDAETVATLAERSRVDVLNRQTSWIEIKSEARTGWVRMLSLRFDQPADASRANAASNPFLAALGKSTGGSVATTGVRGLKEERFTNPSPNPTALQEMQTNAANAGDAAAFAASAGLQVHTIDYIKTGARK